MTDPYYLDLGRFPLADFREELRSGDLVPSRRFLRDGLDAVFEAIASHELSTVADLIRALGNGERIAAVATATGLAPRTLTVLARQARSYRPKVVYFRDIPGLEPEAVDCLARAGILHSKHLFDRGRTPADRRILAEATGLPPAEVLRLVQLSDLARVRGMGPVFVRLFHETGVRTVDDLARRDPETLWRDLHAANEARALSHVVPAVKDVRLYVAMAHRLPKAID